MSSPLEFLTDGANWGGPEGIASRLGTHLWVSVTALAAAGVLAIPLGLVLGHLRRGRVVAVSIANLARAVPSFAVLAFVVAAGGGIGFVPTWTAMVALAVPPLFISALVGVAEIDDAVIDSARGMGMTAGQILRSAEIPLATPLLMSGIRVAFSQVIATATLGAFVGYNTLGRFITVGRANQDDGMLYGGVVVIVATALAADGALRLLTRKSLRWRNPER
ncbi:MAG: ABC transporter permease [Acidimicrobiales bacterium]